MKQVALNIEVTKPRIRITKCSCDKYWYNNKIGQIFDVSDIGVRDYYVKEGICGVLRIDAEILK